VKTISTIIPSIRGGKSLIRSIDSALNQIIQTEKVIVVLSGVKNSNHLTLLDRYKDNNKIDFIFFDEKISATNARNIGFSKTNSDLVHFLDDDDYILKDFYKDTLDLWSSEKIVGVSHSVKWISENNLVNTFSTRSKKNITKLDLLKDNYVGVTSSVVLLSDIFSKVGGFTDEMPARQDYDLWIKMSQYGIFKTTPTPNLCWTHHLDQESVSNTRNLDNHLNAIKMIVKRKSNISKVYKKRYIKNISNSNHYLYLARRAKNINYFLFLKFITMSFFNYPNLKALSELLPNWIFFKLRLLKHKLK